MAPLPTGSRWVCRLSSVRFSILSVLTSILVLHPRHKLSYFKNLKWTDAWIAMAREIVEEEYKDHYEGKFDGEQADDAGASMEADEDVEVDDPPEDEGEDQDNAMQDEDTENGAGDEEEEDEERDPVFSDPEDEVSIKFNYTLSTTRPRMRVCRVRGRA